MDAWLDGELAENQRTGLIAATLYNIHTRKKKDDKVYTWRDFFRDPRPVQPEPASKIEAAFQAITALIKANRNR